LPNVRMLQDLAANPKQREIFEFLCLVPAMGRPFFMSQATPPERAAAIRQAFAATMKDPGFLEDARRARLDVEPLTGEEIAQIVARKFNAPDDVRAVGKKAME
jgi:tripartite-type tricarboxylate transporter receptor subunit TctC